MSSRCMIHDPDTGIAYERPAECKEDIERWGKHYWTGTQDEKAFYRVIDARPCAAGGYKRFYASREHHDYSMQPSDEAVPTH